MAVPMVVLATLCVIFGVFAYAIPLDWLVFPAVPADMPGVWWSGLATVLILTTIALGLILYAVITISGKLRRCETYVGGERLDEVYIHGEEAGPTRHVEVTGVAFYDTVEQLPALRRLYALNRRNRLDVYDLGAKCASYFVNLLRKAHSGALPMYQIWFLVGVLLVLYAMMQGGS